MDRCDFSSVTTIIRNYIKEEEELSQPDFIYEFFAPFFLDASSEDYYLDNGQVCRWMTGQTKISAKIIAYCSTKKNQIDLLENIQERIIPLMYDFDMAVQEIYNLFTYDPSISQEKKNDFIESYDNNSTDSKLFFLIKVLVFSMQRTFVKRDTRNKKLLAAGSLSPVLRDYIMDNDLPKPCRHFCGREAEIETLHTLLEDNGKVFLYGIAGIGKSEVAKAYAKQHKKYYTNILYLEYDGDLKQSITDMDFTDDHIDDTDDERFRKHNRFLRSLKEDTLLIIDNFNTTDTKDSFLSVLLKYHCRILFTTRSRFEHYTMMELTEITDKEVLLGLMAKLYSNAANHQSILEKLIDIVHSHTFAVELSARLLENGILEPTELLSKFEDDNTAFDSSDKIGVNKDGKAHKATYYEHLHLLFSLFDLSDEEQQLMRYMSLVPASGIPSRLLASWLELSNLNTINDLIESGLIHPISGQRISLHPMVQEVAIADMKPCIDNCQALLKSIQNICLLHGTDVSYYKLLFATIENIITKIHKSNLDFYLRFIEDAFPYMDNFHYEQGKHMILKEMDSILSNKAYGTAQDRALLLDFHATCEPKVTKAISLEKQALDQFTEITDDNAHLIANLHANLGGLYHMSNQIQLALEHMEQGISILDEYHLAYSHDSVSQICNYAAVLTSLGEYDQAMSALRKVEKTIKKYNSVCSSDYAVVQEAMGITCLIQADVDKGTQHLKKAMSIYETIWADSPELIEEKYQEIAQMYPQAGIGIAQQMLPSK